MALYAFKSTAAYEQDIVGVHGNHLLLGMFAAALRRDVHNAALYDFQKRLLHALARHVAGDGGIVALAGNLVYLVYEHDAALGALDIVVGILKQPGEDALYIFSHITRLGEDGGVHNGKRHVKHLGDGAGQQGLTCAGGTDQQNVGLLYDAVSFVFDALVVVVYRHRQHLFGGVLANDVLTHKVVHLARLLEREFAGDLAVALYGAAGGVKDLAHRIIRSLCAVAADGGVLCGDEQVHFVLAAAAENAPGGCLGSFCHYFLAALEAGLVTISSIIPYSRASFDVIQ